MFTYAWRIIRPRLRRRFGVRRKQKDRKEYLARKEEARLLVVERLAYWTAEYVKLDATLATALAYKRLAIRNQRSRWGSCSAGKSLNFNYRILDLPERLRDYVIVHELCHLRELHHGPAFWDLMRLVLPDARALNSQARKMRLG